MNAWCVNTNTSSSRESFSTTLPVARSRVLTVCRRTAVVVGEKKNQSHGFTTTTTSSGRRRSLLLFDGTFTRYLVHYQVLVLVATVLYYGSGAPVE